PLDLSHARQGGQLAGSLRGQGGGGLRRRPALCRGAGDGQGSLVLRNRPAVGGLARRCREPDCDRIRRRQRLLFWTERKKMSASRRKSWQEKLTDNKGLPKIGRVVGPMRKTWGTGTLVVPAPIEVDEVMRRVPKGKVTTVNQIRSVLAKKHDVEIC